MAARMARDRTPDEFTRPLRRLLVAILVLVCVAFALVWRIDSPRIERLRAQVIDAVVPGMETVTAPFAGLARFLGNIRSYERLLEQNAELRRDVQRLRVWEEAAQQLEQENAKLRDLNNVRLDPVLTYVTGTVMADSGSPFRQSVLVNVGERDGIVEGWPAMDGLGLVGRVAGVGRGTSRVLLLTDSSSRLPVVIQPSGERSILTGDNSIYPVLDFIETEAAVRPGDRVMTAGDGGLFPAGLFVGTVALGTDGRLRLRLAADYERLEFVRVLRSPMVETVEDEGLLIVPVGGIGGPRLPGAAGGPPPPVRPAPPSAGAASLPGAATVAPMAPPGGTSGSTSGAAPGAAPGATPGADPGATPGVTPVARGQGASDG